MPSRPREEGEFGATTGRRRRCGHLDLPLLKYAVKAGHLTSLALTKLDVLSGMDELKVCHRYQYNGQQIDCAFPGIDLFCAQPLYTDLDPFEDSFESESPSKALQRYIDTIEESVGIPVGILSYGPERNQIQLRRQYF